MGFGFYRSVVCKTKINLFTDCSASKYLSQDITGVHYCKKNAHTKVCSSIKMHKLVMKNLSTGNICWLCKIQGLVRLGRRVCMEPEGSTLRFVREMQFALFVLLFAFSPNSYSISEFAHKIFENILEILIIISDKGINLQK